MRRAASRALALVGALAVVSARPPAVASADATREPVAWAGADGARPLRPASWAVAPYERLDVFAATPRGEAAAAGETAAATEAAATEAAEAAESVAGSDSATAAAPGKSSSKAAVKAGLQSFALPGWGQLSTGRRKTALVFGLLELGTWTSFATFTVQGGLRKHSAFETAELFAGIELEDKDERIRRLVGQFQSSDVYNQYVVDREAVFFYDDPVERAAYIESRRIKPEDAWSWDSFEAFQRYKAERRASEKAYLRSRYALGFAIVNRLASAVVAVRQSRSRDRATAQAAAPGEPRGRLAWTLAPGEGALPESRLAWTITF